MTRPEEGLPRPVAIEPVPGSPFAVAIVGVAPTMSGPALASLVVGAGSVLVAVFVACLGTAGASGGWGSLVAGAFAVLAGCGGVASLALGVAGERQVRRANGAVRGRGLARAGLICGVAGLLLTALAFLAAVFASR